MSELKAKHVVDVYDAYSSNPYNEAQVYLKSEVDSAIDEIKREFHNERHEYIKMVAQYKAKLVEQESLKEEAYRQIKNLKRAIWIAKAERFQSGYFHFDLEKDFWADRGETEKENHYYEKREQCARLEKICRQRAKELE